MQQNNAKDGLQALIFQIVMVLMLINLIVPAVTGSWGLVSRYSSDYTYSFQYNMITQLCSYSSVILLYFLLFINVLSNRNSDKGNIVIFISLVGFMIWSAVSVYQASVTDVLLGGTSTNIILIPLFYILGYNQAIFESAKRMIPYIIVILIGLMLWSSFAFILNYGVSVNTRSSPSKELFAVAISAMWCYSLAMSNKMEDKRSYKYILGILLLICSFLIRSRSWVVQCILMLYTIVSISPDNKKPSRKIISAGIVLVVTLAIIYVFPSITGELFNRVGEDTRSGQYEKFFSQVEVINLLWGQGINAAYSFLGNDNYKYFDNQFIYVMFHYGIISILCMFIVIGGIFRKINGSELGTEEKAFIIGCRIISVFFLMALAGLSIYYRLGWNIGTLLVFIFIGQAHKVIKSSKREGGSRIG